MNGYAVWWVGFTDHTGVRRVRKGFRDKGLTEQLAAKIENEEMLRRRGLIDPAAERLAGHKTRPVKEHLAEFGTHLKAKGRSKDYHALVLARVKRVFDGCGFRLLGDLDRAKAEAYLGTIRGSKTCGHKTHNHYVAALVTFGRWLHANSRVAANPFAGMAKLNAAEDVRHERRALAPDEIAKLVDAARASGVEVQGYGGELRARAYLFSYLTGLRRREMGSLTPGSFALDAAVPTVTVEAAFSKHRRQDTLPLHPELVPMVRDWVAGLGRDEFLFPRLARKKCWLMVKKDLERAGLPYRDANGLFADFHASGRHSYVTGCSRTGRRSPRPASWPVIQTCA